MNVENLPDALTFYSDSQDVEQIKIECAEDYPSVLDYDSFFVRYDNESNIVELYGINGIIPLVTKTAHRII